MSLEQTRHRKQAIGTIHDIVSAMRAIAAGRIQSAQRALLNARRYQEVIVRALASLPGEPSMAALQNQARRGTTLIVMTSEQPFCGAFNQEVIAFAESRWNEVEASGRAYLVVVGQRGRQQMTARLIEPDKVLQATTSPNGLRNVVRALAEVVDQRYFRGESAEVRVIYNRYRSVSEQVPTEERLLPLDFSTIAPARDLEERKDLDTYLTLPELEAGLISEYLFISLFRIAAESFASEQASRLVAMDGATRNTEKMLQSIVDLERRERQEEVTRQMLELISARFAAD
jgi:F-type H+-transporting ATPase subunit gamma